MTKASTLSIAANIFRCNELETARLIAGHPCHRFSATQAEEPVPEPWRGDIERAPLLFILPNAVFDGKGREPCAQETHAQIASHFCSTAHTLKFPPTPLWRSIARRARELYGRSDISPEYDFAVTAVVHCRTNRQIGVATLAHCAKRHLANVLSISHAGVIACFGESVHAAVEDCLAQNDGLLPRPAPLVIALPLPKRRDAHDTALLAPGILLGVHERLCGTRHTTDTGTPEECGCLPHSREGSRSTKPDRQTSTVAEQEPACLDA